MWVRGLKLFLGSHRNVAPLVAPYVGAWIETLKDFAAMTWKRVAPYVGAWIETKIFAININ